MCEFMPDDRLRLCLDRLRIFLPGYKFLPGCPDTFARILPGYNEPVREDDLPEKNTLLPQVMRQPETTLDFSIVMLLPALGGTRRS